MGAAFPVFAGAMFANLGLDWGCSLLGFLSVAFIPIPIALYFFGRKIRTYCPGILSIGLKSKKNTLSGMASTFARHDI